MTPEELRTWFTETLLPELVEKGVFVESGSDQKVEECKFDSIERGVSNFASAPSFVQLVVRTDSGSVSRNILVKFQCQDPEFREKMKLVAQFRNETMMYTEIIPEFGRYLELCRQDGNMLRTVVPLCYHASHGDGDPGKAIVILEDLRPDGFRLADSLTDLDLTHCLTALGKLARFHAVSYAMKLQNWAPFEELKRKHVHVWHEDDDWTRKQCEEFKGRSAQRGIDYLLSNPTSEVPLEYLNNLKRILEPEGLFDLLRELHSPREPLSVICHGDFNRNNVLFKYNRDGELSDGRLIDFQTYLYGSPCLDLSFFIYMNTTLEFREKHFDDIFAHYHTTLVKTVSGILTESEESIRQQLPEQSFKEEFGKVAIAAYVIVSFFLPVMMFPRTEYDFETELKEKTTAELAEENYVQGGETASKRVADVIVDFYRRKFYT